MFSNLFGKKSAASGSAFGRVAGAAAQLESTRGKIVALKDSIAAKKAATADLKSQAEAIHADHDALDSSIADLHSLLG